MNDEDFVPVEDIRPGDVIVDECGEHLVLSYHPPEVIAAYVDTVHIGDKCKGLNGDLFAFRGPIPRSAWHPKESKGTS